MNKGSRAVALVLRVLLTALFFISSIAKLMAIDDFELYIYSYGIFSLNTSYLVARLCIVVELVLALFIAIGWWRRWVNMAAFATLILFSLFLCYAALIGRTDSCQCMGRLANLNPVQSLLKNAVLIVMVLGYEKLSTNTKESKLRPATKGILGAVLALGLTVAVFCISVPDNWMFGAEESRYNRPLLEETIADDGVLGDDNLDEGHHLVAFVTKGCPYCRMTREKLSSISKRNGLDTTLIHYYEPSDLPAGLFLDITYGQRPFILLLDNGVPVVTYHYRNINEKQVSNFLQ